MSTLFSDTTEEAAAMQRSVWRAMSAERKLRQILDASTSMRKIAFAGIRHRHPDYDEHRVKLAWLRITMGPEAFFRLFPNENVVP